MGDWWGCECGSSWGEREKPNQLFMEAIKRVGRGDTLAIIDRREGGRGGGNCRFME